MMLEGAYNQTLTKHIREKCRLFTYKTADRHIAGVPDIYIPGGIWIECKVLKCTRGVNWLSKITAQQKSFMQSLEKDGDYCLVAARFETPGKVYRGVIVPFQWLYRRERVWTVNDARVADKWDNIGDIIHHTRPGNIDRNWYERFLR